MSREEDRVARREAGDSRNASQTHAHRKCIERDRKKKKKPATAAKKETERKKKKKKTSKSNSRIEEEKVVAD